MHKPETGHRYCQDAKKWIHVIHDSPVVIEHYEFPCEVPKDRKVEYVGTAEKFDKLYGDYDFVDSTAPIGHICQLHKIGGVTDHTELLNEKWRIMIEAHNEMDLCVESTKPVPKRYLKMVMGKLTNAIANIQDHLEQQQD